MRGWFAVGLLVCGCLLFGGCGGGDDETGTGGSESQSDLTAQIEEGPTPSKKQYIKEGEEVCETVPKRFQASIRKNNAQFKKESREQKKTIYEIRILGAAVPPLEMAAEEWADLGAPKGDAEDAAKIVKSLEASVVGFEKDPSSNLAGPESPFAEFSKLTKAYGFKLCPQL